MADEPRFVPFETPEPRFQPSEKQGLAALAKELPGRLLGSVAKTGRVALGIDEPQNVTDAALQLMTTAPITAGGGALLKGAPWLGRVLAQAGLGAGQAAARGESVGAGAGKDALAGLTAEALAGLVTHGRIPLPRGAGLSLSDKGSAARAFEFASRAPAEALDRIRQMVPSGAWMNVPAISASPLTPDQAIKGLTRLTGNDYRMAYEQIATEFNALSRAGFGKKAGDWFREFTKDARFMPSTGSSVAERARRALGGQVPGQPHVPLQGNVLRSGLDALSGLETHGVPIGPTGVLGMIGAAPESLGSIASRMGIGR